MDWIKIRILVIGIGFVMDCLFADPVWLYHPVRLMGRVIQYLEQKLRRVLKPKAAGLLLVVGMLVLFGILPGVLLYLIYSISQLAGMLLETFWCYQMLAARGLMLESDKVYRALELEDISLARRQVSMIVGRDTEALDQEGIIRATVETVSENTSDGIIAPLFYMLLGGGALGMCYKAVNTMDSMVGYHNEQYEEFGFFAAKLDDVVNYLPARIGAVFMLLAAAFCGYDGRNALRIFLRDRYQHKSPNSAQMESVCAGALRIRLAGDAWYFGKKVEKPYIGDDLRAVEPADIKRAQRLMYGTTFGMLIIIGVVGVIL